MPFGDKYVNINILDEKDQTHFMDQSSTARLLRFPENVQLDMLHALTIAAEGGKSDNAKPFKGVEPGIFEIAVRKQGDAFRILYAVKIDAEIWVLHAFQKKSKTGIKTPQIEVDLLRDRLKRLKEALK